MWFRRKLPGVILGAVFTLLLLLLLAVIYPLASHYYPPCGYVRDGKGRPIPGARLRFWNDQGHVVTTVRTDKDGMIRRSDLSELVKHDIDGFALTFVGQDKHTPGFYVFTPLGRHEARFVDSAGKPVAGMAVTFYPIWRTWNTDDARKWANAIEQKTAKDGRVTFQGMPVGARLDMRIAGRRYSVRKVTTSVDGRIVRYDVTVGPSAAARSTPKNP